jgi:hypothetical protein
MNSRRSFLQSAAGLAALAPAAGGATPELLPTVKFGKAEVTRLIIGSNPFYGYSHFNRILDQTMREWYTQDRRMEVLHSCERQGINTWQVHFDPLFRDDFLRYRREGGKMNVFLLAQFDLLKDPSLLPGVVKEIAPLGIAHHGNVTDDLFRTGQKEKVRSFLKAVRDSGTAVGISTHNPAVVDTVESEGWDLDYYQTCLYRVTRTKEEARAQYGEAPIAEIYMEKDPERMCKMIRQTKRTCLAFKLFGAGRTINRPEMIETAFRFAFTNIKPGDPVIVGMFPKYSDQVKDNIGMVRRILSGAKG